MLRLYVNMNVLVVILLVCYNVSNCACTFAFRMFGLSSSLATMFVFRGPL
jgi:hypothetical protein